MPWRPTVAHMAFQEVLILKAAALTPGQVALDPNFKPVCQPERGGLKYVTEVCRIITRDVKISTSMLGVEIVGFRRDRPS